MASISESVSSFFGGQNVSEEAAKLYQPVLDMVHDSGGLSSVVARLQETPVAEQVKSWVGTGKNESVSADELADAVGHGNIQKLAEQSGLAVDQVKQTLAEVFPRVVARVTPNGQIPTRDQIGDMVKQMPGAEQAQAGMTGAKAQVGEAQAQVSAALGKLLSAAKPGSTSD